MLPEIMICPHCASPCRAEADFCDKCHSPLTTHATTDPMGTIFAEGFAARRAVTQPQSRLVVTGVWLWLLPLALTSAFMLLLGMATIAGMIRQLKFELDNALFGLVSFALGSFFLYISGGIIYRTTMKSLEGRSRPSRPESGRAAKEDEHITAAPIQGPRDNDAETLTCLACGQRMAQNSAECPACGWSYHN